MFHVYNCSIFGDRHRFTKDHLNFTVFVFDEDPRVRAAYIYFTYIIINYTVFGVCQTHITAQLAGRDEGTSEDGKEGVGWVVLF